jgi:ABC-type phosphate/phosphonate transport system substrate-binding protein
MPETNTQATATPSLDIATVKAAAADALTTEAAKALTEKYKVIAKREGQVNAALNARRKVFTDLKEGFEKAVVEANNDPAKVLEACAAFSFHERILANM